MWRHPRDDHAHDHQGVLEEVTCRRWRAAGVGTAPILMFHERPEAVHDHSVGQVRDEASLRRAPRSWPLFVGVVVASLVVVVVGYRTIAGARIDLSSTRVLALRVVTDRGQEIAARVTVLERTVLAEAAPEVPFGRGPLAQLELDPGESGAVRLRGAPPGAQRWIRVDSPGRATFCAQLDEDVDAAVIAVREGTEIRVDGTRCGPGIIHVVDLARPWSGVV